MAVNIAGQMFDHFLNPCRGWPHPAHLEFTAKQDTTNVLYSLRAGQCCHQETSALLQPGVATHKMPMFLFQGHDDYDVTGLTSPSNQWTPIFPAGNILCFIGKSPDELETTEYVTTQTFNREDLLKSPTGNTANDEGLHATTGRPTTTSSGVLRNDSITLYTTAVVGKVSRGVVTNYNTTMLSFWPLYCPGTA